MKRLGNLYQNIYDIENIASVYHSICKKVKDKRKKEYLKENKLIYISKIYATLKNKAYVVGPYNVFTIYEPKKRRIVSFNLYDKIINHLVSKYIILPAISPCLMECNIASRKGFGTKRGLEMQRKFNHICSIKYKKFHILKCDISKFFQNINHDILKVKLQKKIKDKDALDIIFKIIDNDTEGLSLGTMSSQLLAIFYLSDLDHYIKETLHIKYYVRYQDDFLLYHQSKEYLKYCLKQIKDFLLKEGLTLNKKTRLYTSKDKFIFLGRTPNGKYAKYRTLKRRLKKRDYLYRSKKIPLSSYASSIIGYKYLIKKRAP